MGEVAGVRWGKDGSGSAGWGGREVWVGVGVSSEGEGWGLG